MDSYDFEEGRAVYYLPKLRVEDSGTYVCRAENTAGFVEKSMVLNGKYLEDKNWNKNCP